MLPNIRKQPKKVEYNVYGYFKNMRNSRPNATAKELFGQIQMATVDAWRTVSRIYC